MCTLTQFVYSMDDFIHSPVAFPYVCAQGTEALYDQMQPEQEYAFDPQIAREEQHHALDQQQSLDKQQHVLKQQYAMPEPQPTLEVVQHTQLFLSMNASWMHEKRRLSTLKDLVPNQQILKSFRVVLLKAAVDLDALQPMRYHTIAELWAYKGYEKTIMRSVKAAKMLAQLVLNAVQTEFDML